MSQNQPRTEKIVGHQRKPGRTGGGGTGGVYSGGGGGGAAEAAAPPAAFMSNGLPVNQSSKNLGSQQGGQSKVVNSTNSKSDTAGRAVVNGGACNGVSSQGASVGLPLTNGKLDSLKKVPRAVPKAPATQCTAPAPGGDYTPFLQFGTINPGIVKGMQVPARTCSAPPNLDEQKSDQARHDSLMAVPALPTVSAPKPLPPQPMPQEKQQTKQVVASQPEIREAHSSAHAKRDMIHASMSSAPTTTPARSSVLPVGGIPMHRPHFQRPQVPMQFSGPNMPMQPYGIVPTSFQMTMALPSGNVPQAPQSMFVPSIQSHPMQPQAIMHHGQNLGFPPQLGHQLRSQSMELNITPQFPQPQPGKLVSQRRAVKITHPDTHEELKLDKRIVSLADSSTDGRRQFQNAPSQSSPFHSFNHQTSSYPTAYNHSPMFYPSSSVPLTSTQMSTGPQAARYSYPVGQNGQPISFPDSSHFEATFSGRPGPLVPSLNLLSLNSEGSSLGPPAQVSIKPSGLLPSKKTGTASVRISMPAAKKESSKVINLSADVPVAPQQNDKDVGYQNTGLEQKKNCEQLGTDSLSSENDKNCHTPSGSTHGAGSETLFSVSAPVSDSSISSVAEKDNGREEALIVSEFVQDQQNILCEMELKQFQQHADTVEPSVSYDSATNLSVAKKESSKLIKLSGDVPVAPQQKDEDVGNQSTFLAQNQNCELVTDSWSSENDKNYSTPSNSTHGDGSGPLFSVIAPVSDASISSMAEKDNGREEALVVSECVQDQQNILCEMEFKQFKQEADTAEISISFDSANSLSSSTNLPSIDRESIVSESDKKNDAVEVLDSLRSSLEKEPPSQDAGSAISDRVEASDVGGSFVETCQLQASTSNTVDGISRNFESSAGRCETLEVGDEHEISSRGERASDGVCDGAILRSSSLASSIGCLNDTMLILNQELVTESSEKKAFVLGQTDNSHCASPKKGESNISAIMGAAVSTITTSTVSDNKCTELVTSDQDTINFFNGGEISDPTLNNCEILCSEDTAARESFILPSEMTATPSISSEILEKQEINSVELCNGAQTPMLSGVILEPKAECEKLEVAADTSTPNLRPSKNGVPEHLEKELHIYSRDFMLSLKEQYRDLPYGFEVGPDLTGILSFPAGIKRGNDNDSIASFGRDRTSGPARGDRRMADISDDNRWNKSSGLRMDYIHENSSMNYRSTQGVNNGVLSNPSMHSTNTSSSGLLSGPTHSLSSQGGIGRNNSDLDRWQRPNGIPRGIMPSLHGPMQVIHKSDNRYEIGRASDEEEKKQRRLKAILNKLTPQNFDKLLDQVKEVNIDNTVTLSGVISQIFDKALMEPTFCEMYANFCLHLSTELPDFVEENQKITFRRLLLNKCQEEFERGEREQAEADKADEEGEIQQTEGEREEKRIRAHRRMLGNIRLIGELYKKKMLTDRIMHECMNTLLGHYQSPDEENIEALCKLLSTIGEMIDHVAARRHMDAYFDKITALSTNQKISSRLRFMLKDTIDLRKNKWRQRRKVEGPKKIEDVHRDAAQERQAQTSKVGRGPSVPSRRGPPVDYSQRGSTSSQMSSSIRSLQGNARGSIRQDARPDERNLFENRLLSVPLPHRPSHDGSVTLGPQGGLAKGMSGRGQGLISNIPSAEISSRVGNSHRMTSSSNGNGSISTNDQTSFQGTRGTHFADRAPDRPSIVTSGRKSAPSFGKISASSEPIALSEDTLREKSLSAIREFYSAKDEKEIVRCISDLNTPRFYPAMVSLWVTDSFEMKNAERCLLAQLLVNLTTGHDSLINRAQLIEGFESVLLTLEDAVNDAPKAGEFLGHIFGRVVAENVVQLMEIGKLIHEGGEAPGTLVEAGLGSEILGSLLEFVQVEKGDLFLNDVRVSSKLRLDDFKPRNPSSNSKKLTAFF